MVKLKILISFLILLLLTTLAINLSTPSPMALITNQGEKSLSIVNLKTLELIDKIKVGDSPLGITVLKKKSFSHNC